MKNSVPGTGLVLAFLLLLAAPLRAGAADLYSDINRLRSGPGSCSPAQSLAPLAPQPALERVAREVSQGADLKQSLKESGYRATRSHVLAIRGEGIGAQAAAVLARTNYCQQLVEPGMTDVGLYVDSRQLWIVTAAAFAPAVTMSAPDAGQRVLDLVNAARATPRTCGAKAFSAAKPVRWNEVLAKAAALHAEDMAHHNYFSHTGRDGSSPAQRITRAGYRWRMAGENIAGGTSMQPDEAVAGWIKSPGHCANLMNPGYAEMGVAFAVDAQSDLGVYWAQSFGTPR